MTVPVATRRTTPPFGFSSCVRIAAVLSVTASFVWSWQRLDMSVLGFFSDLQNVSNLLKRMYPPDFADTPRIIMLTLETLWIALLGTFGAVILSYPLAFGAAQNTTRHPVVRQMCRGIITLSRAIPELILAAIFVAAFGPGPLAGVLAIALHSVGMIGRLFGDSIEEADHTSGEAIMSVGATRRQRLRSAVVPQALPSFVATALFRLEINIRGSAVLGLVGAGGIGQLISESLETIQYKPALAAVAVVFVVILAVELVSTSVRQSLIGRQATAAQNDSRWRFASVMNRRNAGLYEQAHSSRKLSPPWTSDRLFRVLVFGSLAALVLFSAIAIDVDWIHSWRNADKMTLIIRQMFPPGTGGETRLIVSGLVESVAISIVSTFLGVIVALPLGILMARNMVASRIVGYVVRIAVLALRGIPELVIAVIFVSAMGLGPVPGTLALSVTVAVFAAKLFADSLENLSAAPRDATVAVGATRMQEWVAAVVPQFISPFVSNLSYLLDVYFRSSTVLGIVGGGGIGYLLIQSIRVYQFKITMTIVISIFVIVLAIEWIGHGMRRLFR